MAYNHLQFDQRVARLDRTHRNLSGGFVTRIRPDGLIVVQPSKNSIQIPAKAVILFVLAFLGFKAFLLASIGPGAYLDRVGRLESGTFVEQAGAWVMQIDPVSQVIANKIGPILR